MQIVKLFLLDRTGEVTAQVCLHRDLCVEEHRLEVDDLPTAAAATVLAARQISISQSQMEAGLLEKTNVGGDVVDEACRQVRDPVDPLDLVRQVRGQDSN